MDILTAELKQEFDEQGFVCLRGFLSDESVVDLLKQLESFIQNKVPGLAKDVVFYDELENKASLKQIQRLFEHDSYFREMMFGSQFEDLAAHLLGTCVKGVNMQYFDKPPGTSLPTPPHQDGFYFMLEPNEAVTMWLALDKTDDENGSVRYIPQSQQNGLRQHQLTDTLGFSRGISDYSDEDLANEISFQLKPGDLLVHHALTIHRADRNRSASRNRRAIGFIYYSVDAVESSDKQKRQDELIRQWTIQGKI